MIVTSCPRCRGPLRRDESLSAVEVPGRGTMAVCPACRCELEGGDPPPSKTYPPGCRMPTEPGTRDAPLTVCGVCRLALFWGDNVKAMRLHADDLSEDGWLAYLRETSDARATHREALRAAEQAYRQAAAGHDLAREEEATRLDVRLEEALLAELALANGPEDYALREARLRADHQKAAEAVGLTHAAATGPARAAREAAFGFANFKFRQAAVAAWLRLRPWPAPEPGAPAPGCYHGCRDCRATYRPRILERLVRLGLAPASLDADRMNDDMMM